MAWQTTGDTSQNPNCFTSTPQPCVKRVQHRYPYMPSCHVRTVCALKQCNAIHRYLDQPYLKRSSSLNYLPRRFSPVKLLNILWFNQTHQALLSRFGHPWIRRTTPIGEVTGDESDTESDDYANYGIQYNSATRELHFPRWTKNTLSPTRCSTSCGSVTWSPAQNMPFLSKLWKPIITILMILDCMNIISWQKSWLFTKAATAHKIV